MANLNCMQLGPGLKPGILNSFTSHYQPDKSATAEVSQKAINHSLAMEAWLVTAVNDQA